MADPLQIFTSSSGSAVLWQGWLGMSLEASSKPLMPYSQLEDPFVLVDLVWILEALTAKIVEGFFRGFLRNRWAASSQCTLASCSAATGTTS